MLSALENFLPISPALNVISLSSAASKSYNALAFFSSFFGLLEEDVPADELWNEREKNLSVWINWLVQWCQIENQQSLFYVVNRGILKHNYIP